MIYTWLLLMVFFVLLFVFAVFVAGFQRYQRRKALELRGYRVEGDPNVDPRSANEP